MFFEIIIEEEDGQRALELVVKNASSYNDRQPKKLPSTNTYPLKGI